MRPVRRPSRPLRASTRPRWWVEAPLLLAVYVVYGRARTAVRGEREVALEHAREIVDVQDTIGLLHERTIQQAFLDDEGFLRFWNIYYGLAHFVVPGVGLLWLGLRHPDRYRFYRNVFGFMLALGLVGFATWPLMPPRFFEGFVDTATVAGGLGPIGQTTPEDAGGNPYAAMPSLHAGWSAWAAVALVPVIRRRWVQVLVALHPVAMLFAVVVTGNHWILDAVAGWAVVAMAWGLERLRRAAADRWFNREPPTTTPGRPGPHPCAPPSPG